MPSRNPFEEIEEMFDRMSRQFEGFDERAERGLGKLSGFAVDVEDREDEYVVTADLPGYDEEEIGIELSEGTLHIGAEHEEETETEEEGEYLQRERRKRSASRSLRLPEAVDEEGASASYRNGVLTVTLPKAEPEDESRDIPIS